MSDDEKKTVHVTSYNQSGGITAGEVTIGKTDRELTPQFTSQLKTALIRQNKDIVIMIRTTHQDGETIRFSEKIKNYLISLGYKAERPNEIRTYATDSWPGDVMAIPDSQGVIKEILVTRQK